MRSKRVSLKDIAAKVGVSVATVSYVLSKGDESKVSSAMAEKVKEAARELNYQPNQIARSLKSGKTNTIGLIVADIANPFFGQIARIVEDEASRLDYTVIIGSSDEKSSASWNLVRFLSNRQVDGFIIVPTENSQEQILYLKEQNTPFVLIDRFLPGIETHYIGINNSEVTRQAISRLLQTGNRKIAFVGYSTGLSHMRERVQGYKEAMKDAGCYISNEWLVEVDFWKSEEGVKEGIDRILLGRSRVEAIFFATNTLAIKGLKYLGELNYRVPQDVATVSFDEGEAFDFYYCPLTHIKQPLAEIAKNAVRILTNQIANPKIREERLLLNAELIIRKSCSRR